LDNKRISFGSITPVLDVPDLLAIQTETFENFIQLTTPPDKRLNKGLQAVFTSNFPILDNKENYRLDFIEYGLEKPRFTVEECMERGLTFSAPLKGKLRLSTKDPDTEEFVNTVEQEVYLGNVPGHEHENTHCPGCSALLIDRTGFRVSSVRIKEGRCPECGEAIPVVI